MRYSTIVRSGLHARCGLRLSAPLIEPLRLVLGAKNTKLRTMLDEAELRGEITVLIRVAAAFGITQKGLDGANRMSLLRARTKATLPTLRRTHQALLTLVLRYFRAHGFAGSGGANAFADSMLMISLRLHTRVTKELTQDGALTPADLRLLIEEVLVPTAFAVMSASYTGRPGWGARGLGCEFEGPRSWYLSKTNRPFTEILVRWLRVAGFRTPCGFSRDSANLKKQVSRWITGKTLPSIEDMDSLVERYKERVDWLDDANTWKARFRLARALQSLWVSAEEYFAAQRLPSLTPITELFERINADGILRDHDGLLADPGIFFAVRLVQLRLRRDGEFAAVIRPKRAGYQRVFPPSVSDAEIDRWRARIDRRMDVGHQFVRYLARRGRIRFGPELSCPSIAAEQNFEDYVLRLGIDELRRLREERRPTP